MTCKICGYHKVCQSPNCEHGKVEVGTRASGLRRINVGGPGVPKYVDCPHCHGTGYCPVNNE